MFPTTGLYLYDTRSGVARPEAEPVVKVSVLSLHRATANQALAGCFTPAPSVLYVGAWMNPLHLPPPLSFAHPRLCLVSSTSPPPLDPLSLSVPLIVVIIIIIGIIIAIIILGASNCTGVAIVFVFPSSRSRSVSLIPRSQPKLVRRYKS